MCISVLRLSKILHRKPLLHWQKTSVLGANFRDLFKTNIIEEIDKKQLKKIMARGEYFNCKSYSEHQINKNHILINDWRFILLPGEIPKNFAKVFPEENGKNIDLEYEKIPLKLQKKFLFYINILKPNKFIEKEVDHFMQKYNFKNVIGLHARRTDYLSYFDGRGKVSTDVKFFEKIEKILVKKPETKFFLATDCKETEKKFIERYGNKIITFPNKDWNRHTKLSIQHSFIDLLLLSKTRHILGTYLSTFTEMAWWFGGCKAKVEIMGDTKTKEEVLYNVSHPESINPLVPKSIKNLFRIIRRRSPFLGNIINKFSSIFFNLTR